MDGQANALGTDTPLEERDDHSWSPEAGNLMEQNVDGTLHRAQLEEDDPEEPDGQRCSLSMDDDGGSTHFESGQALETVVRRGGPIRDTCSLSPSHIEGSDDNDVLFNPAQRLNFDDEDEEEEEGDEFEKTEQQIPVQHLGSSAPPEVDYLSHRPLVNGSDIVEVDAYGSIPSSADQGQNVRIIEGHDSSLLDDGNAVGGFSFGFGFLQPQQVPSTSATGSGVSFRPEEEAQNLYDSLEREDSSSLYGESQAQLLENNTSEYFSAETVSLMAANSQNQDNDSVWPVDVISDEGSYLAQPQQNFTSLANMEQNRLLRQSPPRNFQADQANIFLSLERSSPFAEEATGSSGGFGDVNQSGQVRDGLSLELSEEGLLNNTQTYAQPVPPHKPVAGSIETGHGDLRPEHQLTSLHLASDTEGVSNKPSGANTGVNAPVKNLAWNQGAVKYEVSSWTHSEGDGSDTGPDGRQAGAGSSASVSNQTLISNQNHLTGDSGRGPAQKKNIPGKVQTRRPAVQGSASADDSKRLSVPVHSRSNVGLANVHPTVVRKKGPVSHLSVGSHTHSDQARGLGGRRRKAQEAGKEMSTVSAKQQDRAIQSHSITPAISPLASRANSHTSLASATSSTNSRVSGVGKESHNATNHRGANRGNSQQDLPLSNRNGPGPPVAQFVGPRSSSSLSKSQPAHLQSIVSFQGSEAHSEPPSTPSLAYQPQHQRRGPGAGGGFTSNNNHPFSLTHQHHHHQLQQLQHESSSHHPHNHQQQQQLLHPVSSQLAPADQGASPSGSEGSHHSFNPEAVVSQMDALRQQGHTFSPVEQPTTQSSFIASDIHGLEEVRGHLQSMMRLGMEASTLSDVRSFDHMDSATDLLLDQPVNRQLLLDTDTSSYVGHHPQENMSEILENFPSFSSKMFADVSVRSEAAMHGENQYLKEQLEKESYRRKHCEEQIQKLNTQLLEVQQQLAVAVSTDKKKDIMIEQLDQQLAKVVEGWKKKEVDKDTYLKALMQEKEEIEDTLHTQQTMINNFERDLAHTVEELRTEKEKATLTITCLQQQLSEYKQQKSTMEDTLEQEHKQISQQLAQWEKVRLAKEAAEENVQQIQKELQVEQEAWAKKEEELTRSMKELKESHQAFVNMEKAKQEEQKKRREEAEAESAELKSELKKVVLDLEQLLREKESQKVEMAIMEAKAESSRRKLEADLHTQMEKEISDQASEFHSRMEAAMAEAGERHRNQVGELHVRHQRDLDRQMATLSEERDKKEEDYRRQLIDFEERLQEVRAENSSLKQSKLKLESQRMEILTKLQFMMQSQWNEAVALLVNTPQKKGLNGSFLSSHSGGQLASALAVTDGNTSVTSVNMVSSMAGPEPVTPTRGHNLPLEVKVQDAGEVGMERMCPPHTELSGGKSLQIKDKDEVEATVLEKNEREVTSIEKDEGEATRMDKMEDYLYKMSHQMDVALTRNDLQNSSHSQALYSTGMRQTAYGTRDSEEQAGQCGSTTRHLGQDLSGSRQTELDRSTGNRGGFLDKTPNNAVHRMSGPQVHGYLSSPKGNTIITAGHMTDEAAQPKYQAIPMRSPQQSSRVQTGEPGSIQHQFLVDSSYFHHSYPPLHCQGQQQQFSSSSSLHPGKTSRYGCPLTGDYGDHKEHANRSDINISVFQTPCPDLHSSPMALRQSQAQTLVGRPSLSLSAGSSPGQASVRVQPLSPAKCVRGSRGQAELTTMNGEHLVDSLSPPVKQSAERDHGDALSEASSGGQDTSRLQHSYTRLSEHNDSHDGRQGELQHYVKMLLQKAPGSVCSEPERDIHLEPGFLDSSRDLTVDLDLNDTAQAMELTSQLTRLQQLREQTSQPRSGQISTQQPEPGIGQANHVVGGQLSDFVGDNGVISSEGLNEISQLLSLYRDQWEVSPEMAGQADTASQLIDMLSGMTSTIRPQQATRVEERKSPGTMKCSPRTTQTRKTREINKGMGRKLRSETQSADSSLGPEPLERSTGSRHGLHGGSIQAKKGTSTPAPATDMKKSGPACRQGVKPGGVPAWK